MEGIPRLGEHMGAGGMNGDLLTKRVQGNLTNLPAFAAKMKMLKEACLESRGGYTNRTQ